MQNQAFKQKIVGVVWKVAVLSFVYHTLKRKIGPTISIPFLPSFKDKNIFIVWEENIEKKVLFSFKAFLRRIKVTVVIQIPNCKLEGPLTPQPSHTIIIPDTTLYDIKMNLDFGHLEFGICIITVFIKVSNMYPLFNVMASGRLYFVIYISNLQL